MVSSCSLFNNLHFGTTLVSLKTFKKWSWIYSKKKLQRRSQNFDLQLLYTPRRDTSSNNPLMKWQALILCVWATWFAQSPFPRTPKSLPTTRCRVLSFSRAPTHVNFAIHNDTLEPIWLANTDLKYIFAMLLLCVHWRPTSLENLDLGPYMKKLDWYDHIHSICWKNYSEKVRLKSHKSIWWRYF